MRDAQLIGQLRAELAAANAVLVEANRALAAARTAQKDAHSKAEKIRKALKQAEHEKE